METRRQFCIQPCPAMHKRDSYMQADANIAAADAVPQPTTTTICRTASMTQAKWQKLPFPTRLIQFLHVYSAAPTSLPCTTVTRLSSKSKPCGSKGFLMLWLEKTIPK